MAVQDAGSELSALISRAKQLMGVIDHTRGGGSVAGSDSATTRLLQNGAFSTVATNGEYQMTARHPVQNLHTVAEHEVCLYSLAYI